MYKKTKEELEEEAAALASYEKDKKRRLYMRPVAVIPYQTISKKVTRYGFEREQLSLPQKVMKRYEKFEKS